ncbi:MAG: hypothetical protein EBS83_00970 [Planctomycetia bacterium]|nr:hypothetical protein [Planctomycetia bacterium]
MRSGLGRRSARQPATADCVIVTSISLLPWRASPRQPVPVTALRRMPLPRPSADSLRLDDWQQLLVREALRRAEGRVPDAAEALGISRATLYRKLDQYGLSREEFSRDAADESGDDDFSPDGL